MVQLLVMSIRFISTSCLSTGATRDPGHGTRIARGWVGYRSYQHEFISISCLSTGATRYPGHSTRIARGVPDRLGITGPKPMLLGDLM